MSQFRPVRENLKFLLIEVGKQVRRTAEYLQCPSESLVSQVRLSDDYIDNLKAVIQTKCFRMATELTMPDKSAVGRLRAYEVVAVNLERIGDFCESIIDQFGYVQDSQVLAAFGLEDLFFKIYEGLDYLDRAITKDQVQDALHTCRIEQETDELHGRNLQRIVAQLSTGRDTQTYLTVSFISHYLERMGDSLLNAGEALLSANLGERIKFEQLHSLEESLQEVDSAVDEVAMHALDETRSGAKVARLTRRDSQAPVIFKEGKTEKLVEERDSAERWQELMPGLAPKVFSFQQEGGRSAILFEFLQGQTFERILLNGDAPLVERAFARLTQTTRSVWQRTRSDEAQQARFIHQMRARMEDVHAVHARFSNGGGLLGSTRIEPYEALLDRCSPLDELLSCPFSVFIHGDFNIDNILYDEHADVVHYVDLHRSKRMDYCQDVSVFLVSNFRLQVFDRGVRNRIQEIVLRFNTFAHDFAHENRDPTFALRLGLGLARSFFTSTRFILDEALARQMYLRSRFLLEDIAAQLAEAPSDMSRSSQVALLAERYRLPKEVLLD